MSTLKFYDILLPSIITSFFRIVLVAGPNLQLTAAWRDTSPIKSMVLLYKNYIFLQVSVALC